MPRSKPVRRAVLTIAALALLLPLLSLPSCAGRAPSPAAAPDFREAAIEVRGDSVQARRFTIAELEALDATDKTLFVGMKHEEKKLYRCVPLETVLAAAGFPTGQKDGPKPRLLHAIIARAADDYEALFSSTEVLPGWGPTRVHVAWKMDGADLSAEHGPIRLVVPTDNHGSRSIRQLVTLELKDLGKPRAK